MNKGWLLLKKQEMTKLWKDWKFIPVTLLKALNQEVVRVKTKEKDWYSAIVIGVWKKELNKEKWIKVKFDYITEFKVDESELWNYQPFQELSVSFLEWVSDVSLRAYSKWKWYQWVVKRYWFAWWPATHGSKFHRLPWSIGNRKPRRVNKWHPLPWRMWFDKITLRNRKIIEIYKFWEDDIVVIKWSIPWSYNGIVKIEL